MTKVTEVRYVDYGAQGENGFFGKEVATSNVRGFTPTQVELEVNEMQDLLGDHIVAVYVEEVPAA